jgi:ketosteroid isomerase-like protein
MKNLLLITFLLTLVGTVSAQKADAIFKFTKAANDASLQGHIERNVDKICAVYADDAIILPPGGVEPIRGIKAIREYYAEGFKGGRVLNVSTENISFEVINAKNAVEVGRYTMIYKAANAEKEIEIKGTMLIQWEKNKRGEWKIKLDMWH